MAEARRQSRIKVDDKAHDWITVGRSLLLLLFLFLSPLRPLRTASSIHLARSWLCGCGGLLPSVSLLCFEPVWFAFIVGRLTCLDSFKENEALKETSDNRT